MSPERRYRLLLLCYPRSYRAERAEEMLDVLLATRSRRGGWSETVEVASLVGHGLTQRLRLLPTGGAARPSLGLAGASLVCLLAVLGAQQLVATALRASGLDGYPDAWRMNAVWVDPRWPVHATSVVAGLALLRGRHRGTVALAWVEAALHLWHVAAAGAHLGWPGDIGPHWVAPGGMAEAGWVVLSVAAAVLLGGPTAVGRARAGLPERRWWTVAATGLLGVGVASVALATAHRASGGDVSSFLAGAAPALPLMLASVVLAVGLLQAPHGSETLVWLGMLAAAPVSVRWPWVAVLAGAGAVAYAAGYLTASRRCGAGAPATPGRA